jgi:hypothetical protein
LIVGSSDSDANVVFIGTGQEMGCLLVGTYNGFLVSKGNNTYDNLQGWEGIDVINGDTTPGAGCIKVTGTRVRIKNCYMQGMVLVDASQAQGCTFSDIHANGKEANTTADSVQPFAVYGIGFYLGNNCVVQNARVQGSTWIPFAFSGRAAACLGCSSEVNTVGARFGWVPPVATLQTSASAVQGATTLTFSGPLPGSVVAGLIVSGFGVNDSTSVVSVNQGAGHRGY